MSRQTAKQRQVVRRAVFALLAGTTLGMPAIFVNTAVAQSLPFTAQNLSRSCDLPSHIGITGEQWGRGVLNDRGEAAVSVGYFRSDVPGRDGSYEALLHSHARGCNLIENPTVNARSSTGTLLGIQSDGAVMTSTSRAFGRAIGRTAPGVRKEQSPFNPPWPRFQDVQSDAGNSSGLVAGTLLEVSGARMTRMQFTQDARGQLALIPLPRGIETQFLEFRDPQTFVARLYRTDSGGENEPEMMVMLGGRSVTLPRPRIVEASRQAFYEHYMSKINDVGQLATKYEEQRSIGRSDLGEEVFAATSETLVRYTVQGSTLREEVLDTSLPFTDPTDPRSRPLYKVRYPELIGINNCGHVFGTVSGAGVLWLGQGDRQRMVITEESLGLPRNPDLTVEAIAINNKNQLLVKLDTISRDPAQQVQEKLWLLSPAEGSSLAFGCPRGQLMTVGDARKGRSTIARRIASAAKRRR